jgi:hydrogenase maturation protease
MSGLQAGIEQVVRGRRVAVVGVGNRLRGDDGAGSIVCDRLRGCSLAPVFDAETVPENYLGALIAAAPEIVLFVDAVDHGGAPGHWCIAPVRELGPRLESTHAPSLQMLARLLESVGIESWLIGIQPDATLMGTALSPPVAEAVTRVAEALAAALASALVCEVRHA